MNISKEELSKLYHGDKLSGRQIAEIIGCGRTTILKTMKKYGIHARTRKETSKMIIHPIKYKISKEDLEDLYINKRWSMQQIADIYGAQNSTICSKIRKYGITPRSFEEGNKLSIPRRSKSIAKSLNKYKKENFSENILEKSYLIGFRIGDLHVWRNKYGETIYVSCKSTKDEQINLIKNLFVNYGYIKISKPYKDRGRQISCNLNLSFSFLLKKEDVIEDWILKNKENFAAFLAGYIDAEGHFGIDRNFGEFAISSYEKNIINSINKKLLELNIAGQIPRISQKEGYIDKRGVSNNKDLWTLKIRRKDELLKLINLIAPYIKHQKRYKDMLNVKNNILIRS